MINEMHTTIDVTKLDLPYNNGYYQLNDRGWGTQDVTIVVNGKTARAWINRAHPHADISRIINAMRAQNPQPDYPFYVGGYGTSGMYGLSISNELSTVALLVAKDTTIGGGDHPNGSIILDATNGATSELYSLWLS